MLDDDDLNAAVASGKLTPEQAAGLRDFAAARRSAPAADEENIRLISSFNDIFVTVAVLLTVLAISVLSYTLTGMTLVPGPCVAVAVWFMAEYFTRKRLMALPSICLMVLFSVAVGVFGFFVAMQFADSRQFNAQMFAVPGLVGLASAGVAALVHWRRFHVPVTVAVLSASALAALVVLLVLQFPGLVAWRMQVFLLCGLLLFGFALWWDASDVARRTRRSDVAFWLHLVAAPMMVHPVFEMLGLTRAFSAEVPPQTALAAIALYAALAVVALVIDRRAMLLSALVYVLYALASLLAKTGSATAAFALTGLVIGSTLLLLSVWWRGLRGALLRRLPRGLREMVPAIA